MGDQMARTVNMLMRCDACNALWNIDDDPESCVCDDDFHWFLIVEDEDE